MSINISGTTPTTPTAPTGPTTPFSGGKVRSNDDDVAGAAEIAAYVKSVLPEGFFDNKADMRNVMAAFEALIILMSQMGKEVLKGQRESEVGAMMSKISTLLSAADTKMEAADTMMAMAIVSVIVGSISAGVSLAGAGIQAAGAFKGVKAANEAAGEFDALTQKSTTITDAAQDGAQSVAKKTPPKLDLSLDDAGEATQGVQSASKTTKTAVEGTQDAATTAGTQATKGTKSASETPEETLAAGEEAAKAVKRGLMKERNEAMGSAFQQASTKLHSIGTILENIGRLTQNGAQFAGTYGQAENQRAQAAGDVLAAEAETHGMDAQKAQQLQADMATLLAKMMELLVTFYSSQDKISSSSA